jgi:hypothetical protein
MDACKGLTVRRQSLGQLSLLLLTGALFLSGLFALYLAAAGRFLPHDEHFLGMTAADLCRLHECRIVHFMVHDRASFGGALVALSVIYSWVVLAPLGRDEKWAWWLLLCSGSVGFVSFLAYLGYGYLDTWHGVATLALVPCFAVGLVRSRTELQRQVSLKRTLHPFAGAPWKSPAGFGRVCLLGATAGLTVGGLTILLVGATCVFVPQDLEYMGVSVADLHRINPRLVALIAHDRAGFGGAVCSCGLAMFLSVWRGQLTRGLWRTLCVAGFFGFGTAIGVHPAVGYVSATHLAPAVIGAIVYAIGLALSCPRFLLPRVRRRDWGIAIAPAPEAEVFLELAPSRSRQAVASVCRSSRQL